MSKLPPALKFFVGGGIAVLLLPILAWFFGVQAYAKLQAHNLGKKSPCVWRTPVPIADETVAPAHGTPFAFLDYTFNVPWNDLDPVRTINTGSLFVLHFQSRRVIMVNDDLVFSPGGGAMSRKTKPSEPDVFFPFTTDFFSAPSATATM